MYNQTTVDWLKDLASDGINQCLTNYEIILISFVALVALVRGRNFWMNVLNVWIFMEAAVLVVWPEQLLKNLVTGTPDSIHIQLTRGVGILLVFWCVGYWLLYRSTDSTVQTSLQWALTLQAGCSLIALAYLVTHPMRKGSPVKMVESMTSPFFSSLIFLLVTGYFALKSTDWGGYSETPSHSNLHLRADFVLLTVMGVLLYALPQWVIRISMDLEKMDALHAYLARVAGSILISMAIMSGRAANFLRPSDKDAHMLGHWMYFVTVAMFGTYALYSKRSEVTWQRVGLQSGHDLVLVMNATGALNIDPSVFQRVLVPRVKGVFSDVTSMLKFKLKRY